MTARKLAAYGLSIAVPPGWDARIERRPIPDAIAPPALHVEGDVPVGGTVNPVVHVADFPLPERRGDYGSGAIERMAGRNVFATIVEFDPEASTQPLFDRRRVPRFAARDVAPEAMQRVVAGMAGGQKFFTVGGRAFSCYVVVGSYALRSRALSRVNAVLASLEVDPH